MPNNSNLYELMQAIRRAEAENNIRRKLSDAELEAYVRAEANGGRIGAGDPKAKYVAELLARSPRLRREAKQHLPAADRLRKEKMAKLRTAAGRTGMDAATLPC